MLPGKCILNSINLETGEDRFEVVSDLLKLYGGSVVVGCIDEDPESGMAVTRERKLEVAQRSYDLLTKKYGLAEEDIIWDPLVFPCGTGDVNYIDSARETVEGIRLIKERFPNTKTILGISNVSFGLPEAGREILNSVFLYHCTKAGLDMAIVNSQKIERYANIPEADRAICEELIFRNSQQKLDEFVAHFRVRKAVKKADEKASWSVEDRLIANLVEGSKDGLIDNLNEALKKYSPLDVINLPLMDGMNKVGKLFNANELIVAEVLQSAGVMKAAVAHLQQFMAKNEESCKAKVLLATVKGDVHDIGKNLVEIILGNNGYEIINLGIKIPSEAIIEAYRRHKPDFIGLSGLLVKSALQMVDTVDDLRNAGVTCPILVGGAALSRKFTDTRIAPKYGNPVIYAVDAMTGLDIVNNLIDPIKRTEYLNQYEEKAKSLRESGDEVKGPRSASKRSKLEISHEDLREAAPSFEPQIFEVLDTTQVWPYLNEQFFYTQHMGFKGSIRISLEKKEPRAVKLWEQIEELKAMIAQNKWFDCKGVYQYFEAEAEGNLLKIFNPAGQVLETFEFPRQKDGEELCVADFVAPSGKSKRDTIAMFAMSSGYQVREVSEKFKRDGDFFRFHALQALAVEAAEALAEMVHQHIRKGWGILEDLSFKDLIQTRYQGIRLSFGYPACPNLDDQAKLFQLIKPEKVGIQLTENMMMEPEGSVSAVVFSHPAGKYFSVES
jgi:5-methyltetrahydrofolate--homocysteine methyltransferase